MKTRQVSKSMKNKLDLRINSFGIVYGYFIVKPKSELQSPKSKV